MASKNPQPANNSGTQPGRRILALMAVYLAEQQSCAIREGIARAKARRTQKDRPAK